MRTNIIVLAAGNSVRFQGIKLFEAIEGRPMYQYVIEKAIQVKADKIIVVTQFEEIKNWAEEKNLTVVMNPNSAAGISGSIRLGISADDTADAYVFMVCDQPFITVESINGLLKGFYDSEKGMACVKIGQRLGNPCVFSKKYKDDLLALEGDAGGKKVLCSKLEDVFYYCVENEWELMDVDSKEDFRMLMEGKGQIGY